MIQENGMPIEFELVCKKTGSIVGKVSREWFIGESFGTAYVDLDKHCLRQAIGATSSDDPPQELYLGDLIELTYESTKDKIIGLIVWKNFSVMVKVKGGTSPVHWDMKWVLETYQIKKLGSRYTKEGKEISKKAGLE